MIPRDLPEYVERGGRQVWRPPYSAQGATAFGFVLKGEQASIDRLLQRDLVEPAGGAVDYRCATDRVIVMFAEIERLSSKEAPDSERGYVKESEVSVWCLAADARAGDRLVWYLPYVFVDSGQAAASGREVFGYPKEVGIFDEFSLGDLGNSTDGGGTVVKGWAIDPFDKEQAAAKAEMISATRDANSGDATGIEPTSCVGLAEALAAELGINELLPFGREPEAGAAITPIDSSPPPASESAPVWASRRVLDTLVGRGLDSSASLVGYIVDDPTLVFLKQFRDASCPTKACYQSIVEAPLSLDPLSASYEALDPGAFGIKVEDWDSHPIATDLGVAEGTPLTPEIAFRAEFDFDIDLGVEVWRAQT